MDGTVENKVYTSEQFRVVRSRPQGINGGPLRMEGREQSVTYVYNGPVQTIQIGCGDPPSDLTWHEEILVKHIWPSLSPTVQAQSGT